MPASLDGPVEQVTSGFLVLLLPEQKLIYQQAFWKDKLGKLLRFASMVEISQIVSIGKSSSASLSSRTGISFITHNRQTIYFVQKIQLNVLLIMGFQFIINMILTKEISQLIILTLLVQCSIQRFQLGWGLYRWVVNDLSLYEPLLDNSIQLSHPSLPYLSVQIMTKQSALQNYNSYNVSQYLVNGKGTITVMTSGKTLSIQFIHVQHFVFNLKCTKSECRSQTENILKQLETNTQIQKHCKLQQLTKFQCSIQNSSLLLEFELWRKENAHTKVSKEEDNKNFMDKTLDFMNFHNISITNTNIDMVQQSFSSFASSICLYEYDGDFHLGFCEQNRMKKWNYDFKLAPFAIYLMADYYYALAQIIYKDFFVLTQTKLLYPVSFQSQILPLPQHIEVFTRFGPILGLQNQVQLLNSMFVVPMLNQLGTLHEQLNYRQAKKMHPLLLKMITQKWSSNNLKSTIKSIYQQSFTQDYKFHDYGERLQQSVGKMAWIFKVIDTFTGILIKHHAYYMPVEQIKEHLQEHFTLLNIYRVYFNDDNNAKVGKYKDIIDVGEDLKLYSKYNGYQSLFPYAYGLGKVYPEGIIKQLQTSTGLKSSNQQQRQQHEKKYRYRGDIHAYFNVKLLSTLIYKLQQDKSLGNPRKKQLIANLAKLGNNFANKLISLYKKDKIIYTSWNQDGKPRESRKWLQIVAVLALKWL